MIDEHRLAALYQRAHDEMRSIDGLQPTDALDELLKYLFFKETDEERGPKVPLAPEMAPPSEAEPVVASIRLLFDEYLRKTNGWTQEIWADRRFRLSDAALLTLHRLLGPLKFQTVDFDVRSAALRTFISPEMRRGLGIFLTPDSVVKMMVEIAAPAPDAVVYDPACGSGTFLVEILSYWARHRTGSVPKVWGSDKSARMLLLADLNLGHSRRAVFNRKLVDFLVQPGTRGWLEAGSVDMILTNPPFGVVIDAAAVDLSGYATAHSEQGVVYRAVHEDAATRRLARHRPPPQRREHRVARAGTGCDRSPRLRGDGGELAL
jgi:type I restriction enzyme M protein